MSEGEGARPSHGSLMSPGLNAQIHQHFFCVRMDPAIDCGEGGKALTVTEVINLIPAKFGPNFQHEEPS